MISKQSEDLKSAIYRIISRNLPNDCKLDTKDRDKMAGFDQLRPLFLQAVTLLEGFRENDDATSQNISNISDELGITQAPRLSVLMQNDDYSQPRSATKRHMREMSRFEGEIVTQPQMIHLYNLNPVASQESMVIAPNGHCLVSNFADADNSNYNKM